MQRRGCIAQKKDAVQEKGTQGNKERRWTWALGEAITQESTTESLIRVIPSQWAVATRLKSGGL